MSDLDARCDGPCQEIRDLRWLANLFLLSPVETVIGEKKMTIAGVKVGRTGGGPLSKEELVTAKDYVLQHILAVSNGRKLNTPKEMCSHFRGCGPVAFSSGVPAILAEFRGMKVFLR